MDSANNLNKLERLSEFADKSILVYYLDFDLVRVYTQRKKPGLLTHGNYEKINGCCLKHLNL